MATKFIEHLPIIGVNKRRTNYSMCVIVEMSALEAMIKGWNPDTVTLKEFERFSNDVDGFETYLSPESDRKCFSLRSIRSLDFIAKRDEVDEEQDFDVPMRTGERLTFCKYQRRKSRSQKRKSDRRHLKRDHQITLKLLGYTELTTNHQLDRKFVPPDSRHYKRRTWHLLNRAVRQQGNALCKMVQRVSESEEYDDLSYLSPKEVARLRALPDEVRLDMNDPFHY